MNLSNVDAMSGSRHTGLIALATVISAIIIAAAANYGGLSAYINYLLNPPQRLGLGAILLISLILGLLHGATPDEHTWPITFSYAIGSYSTRKGMKMGFAFSAGFTVQRAILTTLGFIGLAAIYRTYNLDGPVYILVGIVMALAGAYVLNKKRYIHLPIDLMLHGKSHHTQGAQRVPMHKTRNVSTRMAVVHGLIAGWGFGAYATILVFVLTPQVPGLIYAPLPGLLFGIGTMMMQIIYGAIFANLARLKKLSEDEIAHIGRKTAGRTLYYGGMLFALIGLLIVFFPTIDSYAISTGIQIPNLDSITVATVLVLGVVGIFGLGNLILGILEILKHKKRIKDK
jgi:ABC-type nickel/cobalt efflux system permease component RcnA